MYIPVVSGTIILSLILSVQGRSLPVSEEGALEFSNASGGGLLDYIEIRRAKQERRKALRAQGEVLNKRASPTLDTNALQTGSALNGLSGTVEAGESASLTDDSNFINFCSGQTLTNGLQIKTGSCNGISMGQIPATTNMISAVIQFPRSGKTVRAGQTFNISVLTQGLAAGVFTNPASTYYSAPQHLDRFGKIIGHIHVTVQDLGRSLNPTTLPDPTKFAFFKGINDAGNGEGLLQATVPGGLPAGNYRVCTIVAAANHQPVLMPVAQRGAQDDCTKFKVVGPGGTDTCNGNTNTAASCTATSTASATNTKSCSAIGTETGKGNAASMSATSVTSSTPTTAVAASATNSKTCGPATVFETVTAGNADATNLPPIFPNVTSSDGAARRAAVVPVSAPESDGSPANIMRPRDLNIGSAYT